MDAIPGTSMIVMFEKWDGIPYKSILTRNFYQIQIIDQLFKDYDKITKN
jgi:hypothetical protein